MIDMPCLAIHLAVAKKYYEKHRDLNYQEFIDGTLAPDLGNDNIDNYINILNDDKTGRHFSINSKTNNVIEYIKRKVDFKLFFQHNDINSSFLKGYFLHLLCDHYYFKDYVMSEDLKKLSLEEAIKICYNDYDIITPILIDKYHLEIPKLAESFLTRKGSGNLVLLNEDNVYKFIDDMSNLDLIEEKIKKTS